MRRIWNSVFIGVLVALVDLSTSSFVEAATPAIVLHSFKNAAVEGFEPSGGVTLVGSKLFGTTYSGGQFVGGTVFSLNIDGTQFETLHAFGGSGDGSKPLASFVAVDHRLFGITDRGGSPGDNGTIYAIEADGSDYQQLTTLRFGARFPKAQLIADGNTLYGTSYWGPLTDPGAISGGTVFSYDISSSTFAIVHAFSGGNNDGRSPASSLSLVGNKLYGATEGGGNSNAGTVFSLALDGGQLDLLHEFDIADGKWVVDSLAANERVYGVTYQGGLFDAGTIFSCNLDGTGFNTLHNFDPELDGGRPAEILLLGNRLYGIGQYGTNYSPSGSIFSINIDGSGFRVFHEFTGESIRNPTGDLTTDGNFLYGTARTGGQFGFGAVFAVPVPEPASWILACLGGLVLIGFKARWATAPTKRIC